MSTQTVGLALELAIQLLTQSQRVSQLVLAAQSANREIMPEEWDAIVADANASRVALVEAIERAKALGH